MELGISDICVEISMTSSQFSPPSVGNLQEVLYIFSYLKSYTNSELVFDPSENAFEKPDFPG